MSNFSSYITSAGLQAVTSAGQIGPYFAIKYFVPFYDPRFDTNISYGTDVNTSALNISALNLTSATAATLQGERIYASMAKDYSLSPSNFLYQQNGMSSLPNGGSGTLQAKQNKTTNVNTLSAKPLSPCLSAVTIATTSTPGSFTLTNTTNVSGTSLASYNPLSASPFPTSAFYRVQSYSPKALGSTSATGSYKCRIPAGDGSFKFNGLALFVSKVDQYNYDTLNTSPVLFAVVLLDKAQEKSNTVGGMNSYEFDIDLGFDWSTIGTAGNTPVYVETGYWTKVPTSSNTSAYALNYDGDVVISSSASPGSWMPQAKMTITDPQKPQLRLSYNNNDSYGDRFTDLKTRRFNVTTGNASSTGATDRAVLSIDTSCADDSLLELGPGCYALSRKSLAIGTDALVGGYKNGPNYTVDGYGHNLAFGISPRVLGDFNLGLGLQVSAVGSKNISIGQHTYAGNVIQQPLTHDTLYYGDKPDLGFNIALGWNTSAVCNQSGQNVNTTGYFTTPTRVYGYNVAIGKEAFATFGYALAFGESTSAIGSFNTSIGNRNYISGTFNTGIGYKLSATNDTNQFSVMFGLESSTNAAYSFVGGVRNRITSITNAQFNFVYGYMLSATDTNHAVMFGDKNEILSNAHYSFTHGLENINSNQYTMTFGFKNSATNVGSYAHGTEQFVSGAWSTSFGNKNVVKGKHSFGVGSFNDIDGENAIGIGFKNYTNGLNSIGIGQSTSATNGGIAIGNLSKATQGISIGIGSLCTNQFSTSIGCESSATGSYSDAFGYAANAQHTKSTAIGPFSTTTMDSQVFIGSKDTKNITLKADDIILDGNVEFGANYEMHYRTTCREYSHPDYLPTTYTSELVLIKHQRYTSKISKVKIERTNNTTYTISKDINSYNLNGNYTTTSPTTSAFSVFAKYNVYFNLDTMDIIVAQDTNSNSVPNGYVLVSNIGHFPKNSQTKSYTQLYCFDNNTTNVSVISEGIVDVQFINGFSNVTQNCIYNLLNMTNDKIIISGNKTLTITKTSDIGGGLYVGNYYSINLINPYVYNAYLSGHLEGFIW